MQRSHRTSGIRRRWASAIMVLTLAGATALAITVFASGSIVASAHVGASNSGAPLTKAEQIDQQMAAQRALAQKEGSKKHITAQERAKAAVTLPASCPAGPMQTYIVSFPDGTIQQRIVNSAEVAPAQGRPYVYSIYAGSLMQNAQQGVLVVIRQVLDPCANKNGTQYITYLTPQQQGAITITQINGDDIVYRSAAGQTGQFDFVTGQFS